MELVMRFLFLAMLVVSLQAKEFLIETREDDPVPSLAGGESTGNDYSNRFDYRQWAGVEPAGDDYSDYTFGLISNLVGNIIGQGLPGAPGQFGPGEPGAPGLPG
uniref:Uncharacterized protein n=1 Tax=Pseudodiaptomus poplesia TaxID=213370 RepID=A0A0U2USY2_9MAXI|nr:hypothetical protein [Pseudodiaptomus poplesia]